MTVERFRAEAVKSFQKYFPLSSLYIEYNSNLYPSIDVRAFLAGSIDEVPNKIWLNDMLSVQISVTQPKKPLPSHLKPESELPQLLEISYEQKSYNITPINHSMAYGRTVINTRSIKGDASKIVDALDKFFMKLKENIINDFNSGLIHPSYVQIVQAKVIQFA